MKTINEMQQEVDQYIQQFKTGYFSPLAQMARITEEVGELAREVNHSYGEKQKKKEEPENSVEQELADVFITLIMLANSLEIDLTEAFNQSMQKFQVRDRYRFERRDGKTDRKEGDSSCK